MDQKTPLPDAEDAMDELPSKGEIPQEIEHELLDEEAETDDAEERVIDRNPSREGGAFDDV